MKEYEVFGPQAHLKKPWLKPQYNSHTYAPQADKNSKYHQGRYLKHSSLKHDLNDDIITIKLGKKEETVIKQSTLLDKFLNSNETFRQKKALENLLTLERQTAYTNSETGLATKPRSRPIQSITRVKVATAQASRVEGKISLKVDSRRDKTTGINSERQGSTEAKNSIVVYQHLASDYKRYMTQYKGDSNSTMLQTEVRS